jgi:dTMP kinase
MSDPAAPASRGWFITIEGPEGGGKTTQAERLRAHLEAGGRRVHLTREPGGTWLGERLREVVLARTAARTDDAAGADGTRAPGAGGPVLSPTDPLTDALLFNAARRQLVGQVIRPMLEAGATVVCARFADSTLAYQGYGSGVPLDRLRQLADLATDGLTPDLTIVLDVPVEAGLARKAPDDVTRFEAEFDLDFHGRVRAGFLALAAGEPDRFVVIDATAPLDDVAAAVAAAVDARLAADEPESSGVRTHR